MNLVDAIILVVLAGGVVAGFRQGFVVELATMVGAFIGLAVARMDYTIVTNVLGSAFPHSKWLTAFSYLLVFAVVWALVVGIARAARRVLRWLFLGWADRLAGAVLGLVPALLLVELLLYLGKRVPNKDLHHAINHAQLAHSFLHLVPYVDRWFPHV